MKKRNKLLLIILDGWGLGEDDEGNAIARAKTPTFDKLWKEKPKAVLTASGEDIGLPEGQMGTSEVNHLTIGSGRVFFQELVRINRSIREGEFTKNPQFLAAFEHVKKHDSVLHIIGMVSPGGVHSHQDHVKALIKAAKENEVKRVLVHVITDGRDTLSWSGKDYVADLQDYIEKLGVGKIASVAGRYFAMDRDRRWQLTDDALAVVQGKKDKHRVFSSVEEAMADAYGQGETDEMLTPRLIEVNDLGEVGSIATDDAVIEANFRSDRMRQTTERLLEMKAEKNLEIVTMTNYNPHYSVRVAFDTIKLKNTLGEVLSGAGIRQLRITETEKFNHLTYFFNAKREEAFEGEDRFMIDSYSDVKLHDDKPEMRTPDLAKRVIQEMTFENYDFMVTNWCNGDLVGHSGNIPAVIIGIETIDKALEQVLPVAAAHGYEVIVTADHGNAEEMLVKGTGEKMMAHTINPVPFMIISKNVKKLVRAEGTLADIAPTILTMMGLEIPREMTGESLV
ncbi:2,3-bisphosphoglycerate-independent phosphoglycerate mutase [Microgenomates group bacterium]|nr:2,3-bisphosphoglycerate-independent phosphoglycerate mutase [Microgenomates group bacterium]